jgi:hypothetical protein
VRAERRHQGRIDLSRQNLAKSAAGK